MEFVKVELFSLKEDGYKNFISALVPNVQKDKILGVRIPILRKFSKELIKNGKAEEFISQLPHDYFDENNLHALCINNIKDYSTCVMQTEKFLPYVDNWETCDILRPKIFGVNKDKLILQIENWINSCETYKIRFGIEMLMVHFLGSDYKKEYLYRVSCVKQNDYYVKMAIAWYLATAMYLHFEDVKKILKADILSPEVEKMTIKKAFESYKISQNKKEYLKLLLEKSS